MPHLSGAIIANMVSFGIVVTHWQVEKRPLSATSTGPSGET